MSTAIEKRYYEAAQPFYPRGFSINWRNPGHWDVYAYEVPGRISAWLEANPGCSTTAKDGERTRAFRIRGEPKNVIVHDERWNPHNPQPREPKVFRSVAMALVWIADELMQEP